VFKIVTKGKDLRLFVECKLERVPTLGNSDQDGINELEPAFLGEEPGNHLAPAVLFTKRSLDQVCGRDVTPVLGRTAQVLDAGFKIILEAFDSGKILSPVL
jgi:hypothetical protein